MKALIIILTSLVIATLASSCAQAKSPSRAANLNYQKIASKSSPRQKLDIYFDKSSRNKLKPVVIWVHGGGWMIGNKSNKITAKAKAFTDAGYVLVAINYRLHPQASWRAQAQDVATATRWINQHIQPYGGDPKRLILMGHSAGAHLVALVSADPRYLKKAQVPARSVKATVLLDGAGYDIPERIKKAKNMNLKLYLKIFGSNHADHIAASPISYMKKNNSTPAFLIIPCANRAASVQQSNSLAKAITTAGNKAIIYQAKNRNHMTLNRNIGIPNDPATEKILNFLNGAL